MVEVQLAGRDVRDEKVLETFLQIPRELFVLEKYRYSAYDDSPLPIGYGQTISQPYMVAKMTEILNLHKNDILLEIGSGSGYQAAIASRLCKFVYSVELVPELAEFARNNLEKAGIDNVEVICGDGSIGLEEFAPYDKIVITAAIEEVPLELFDQLKDGGCIVAPEGPRYTQQLVKYEKINNEIVKEVYFGCVFVPLRGEKGFKE
ncbi:protein-L-isoaspartate(D-aspartate) O-methyltransferase [Deferribacter autotrophicus]|uniref:Protein-L-isoaspartate O-methyltransferase n=2 Tax=Deferribacter autotrophicus TaxID=500465 RepID=A0A5A8F3T7_9BACT|nr:protein-L-isoaspartate(D-aspartate) O-methyltransferase [Deferribacter autotrophicus]